MLQKGPFPTNTRETDHCYGNMTYTFQLIFDMFEKL